MANYFSYFLLLLFTTVALTTTNLRRLSATGSLSPAPSPSTRPQLPVSALPISPPSPPPPPPEYIQQEQLKNIIDALIGAGDFAAWANILFNPNTNSSIPTTATAALIPTTATMFVPGNDALTHLSATATGAYNFDPFIIPYHILPQRLTFSELQLFKTQTRLPTLLPSKTVIITNNTAANFTIDDSLIEQPDIYLTAAVCVHGIATILDYTVYGDADSTPPSNSLPPPPLPTPDTTLTPPPELCILSDL
ncbi:FAS1 domain-containing protein SELMODRAFT_448915-like [Cynara cardunculus var. scolymus]|uniref:FAS1 domain-containing protein SELMODRAFT_448915-like n=1 Tax=Cynara cardunculus var. scolymus TaxID=59895 RepID=UPI000D62C20F|nr:FAS1 domain-containing protein SELMODRAFT_448915-like [Cynara cardunculus var. scolymus]